MALAQVVRGDYRPVRKVNREAPAALVPVCRKAMATEAKDRYVSAKEVAGGRALVKELPGVPLYRDRFARTLNSLAMVRSGPSRPVEASSCYVEALTHYRSAAEQEPGDPDSPKQYPTPPRTAHHFVMWAAVPQVGS